MPLRKTAEIVEEIAMKSIGRIVLAFTVFLGLTSPGVAAGPEWLRLLQSDPLTSRATGCTSCHVAESGGETTGFGRAFDEADRQITPLLRAGFPDLFRVEVADAGGARVYFADPDERSVVIEIGRERFIVDIAARDVRSIGPGRATDMAAVAFEPVAALGAPVVVGVAPDPLPDPAPNPAPSQTSIPVDEEAREGAVFGSRVVNLSSGKAIPDGGIEFLIGHRFSRPLFESDSPADLFGFDSPAQVTFGVGYGLTDWLGLSVIRSNDKTIAFDSTLQVTNQDGPSPFSTQFRVGVDGNDNFSEQYSPYFQFVAARTFGDRFSLVLSPGVAFNTRDDSFVPPPELRFDGEHDYTASFGVGASLRVRPTVSLVGEYVPRIAGFRGDFWDRPSVSFGVQKSTFRHTFEFVISNTFPMTTSGYTVNGTDTFKVGFNIYRRLR
jgi:hypothetical protein